MTAIYGPMVRWFNPLRVKVRRRQDGWEATYRHLHGKSQVSGCGSKSEARAALKHFVTMRVADVGGRFVEVARH